MKNIFTKSVTEEIITKIDTLNSDVELKMG